MTQPGFTGLGSVPSTLKPPTVLGGRMDVSADARKKAADNGEAMPDGSFPIRNKADLARAIMALGRAKDPQAAKRFIIKRARELDALELLPKSWNVT